MLRFLHPCLLSLWLFFFLAASEVRGEAPSWQGVAFSAEVKRQLADRKNTLKGKMFVSADGVRSEGERNGVPLVVIHRPAQKTIWTLFPAEKLYMERVGVTVSPPPLPDDAASPCKIDKTFLCRLVGKEKFNDRSVAHWEIVIRGPEREIPHAHLWVDERLHIAIREQYPDGVVVELNNIKEEPQSPELFRLPKEYQKVDIPGEPAKTGLNPWQK